MARSRVSRSILSTLYQLWLPILVIAAPLLVSILAAGSLGNRNQSSYGFPFLSSWQCSDFEQPTTTYDIGGAVCSPRVRPIRRQSRRRVFGLASNWRLTPPDGGRNYEAFRDRGPWRLLLCGRLGAASVCRLPLSGDGDRSQRSTSLQSQHTLNLPFLSTLQSDETYSTCRSMRL